jgi:hypothetical protein
VPNLVPIKKREAGRRPPWIRCKLCLDLSEIFLVCILFCVGTKSEIFLLVFVALVWSVLLAACPNFLKQFHSGVFSRRPFTCALRPGFGFCLSHARVGCFRFPPQARRLVFLRGSALEGSSPSAHACLFFREILWLVSLLLRSADLLLPVSALLIFAHLLCSSCCQLS